MNELLITCDNCGGNACHTHEINTDINSYLCYGCGYWSNSLMKIDEPFYNEQLELLPELYKDLLSTDKEGKIWVPQMVNIPDKGMVFRNGTDVNNWEWVGVLSVKISKEEKKKYKKVGKGNGYYEYKMDMSTLKGFGVKGFIDALEYIGIFENPLVS